MPFLAGLCLIVWTYFCFFTQSPIGSYLRFSGWRLLRVRPLRALSYTFLNRLWFLNITAVNSQSGEFLALEDYLLNSKALGFCLPDARSTHPWPQVISYISENTHRHCQIAFARGTHVTMFLGTTQEWNSLGTVENISNFLRNWQAVYPRGCFILCFYQQCMADSLHTCLFGIVNHFNNSTYNSSF